jgi:hypothetical protein
MLVGRLMPAVNHRGSLTPVTVSNDMLYAKGPLNSIRIFVLKMQYLIGIIKMKTKPIRRAPAIKYIVACKLSCQRVIAVTRRIADGRSNMPLIQISV